MALQVDHKFTFEITRLIVPSLGNTGKRKNLSLFKTLRQNGGLHASPCSREREVR